MLNYHINKIRRASFLKAFDLSLELNKVMPPKFIVWDCTRRCNLNCEHCGAKKETYGKELSTAQVKQSIKKLRNYGIKHFVVTGGEPLLRNDLFEIFSYAKKLGLKTGLSTNGILIDDKNAKKIAAFFDSIQISLDGTREIHNKIRGNSQAFQKTIKAIKILTEYPKNQITISSVITKSNIDNLEQMSRVIEKMNVDCWKISSIMPIGNVNINRDLYLNKKQFLKLIRFAAANKKRLKIEVGENLGYLGKYDKQVKNEPFLCPVGYMACCIGVDGNIRGCPEQPDNEYFKEGNTLDDDFARVWEKGFKKYRTKQLVNNKRCKNCKYQNNCYGGCWVMKLKNINCSVNLYGL